MKRIKIDKLDFVKIKNFYHFTLIRMTIIKNTKWKTTSIDDDVEKLDPFNKSLVGI